VEAGARGRESRGDGGESVAGDNGFWNKFATLDQPLSENSWRLRSRIGAARHPGPGLPPSWGMGHPELRPSHGDLGLWRAD
jgi:hypothetical protein